MEQQSHHIPQTLHRSAVARLLHEVCTDLTRAVSHHLPGLDHKFAHEVVVIADGTRLTGELGSYTVSGCSINGRTYDKLSISVRHPAHTEVDPEAYAAKLLTTLAHELAHACTLHRGDAPHGDRAYDGHSEDFVTAAEQLGLEVSRCDHHPRRVFTQSLTPEAQRRYRAQIRRLAGVNFVGTHGVGLAGPHGLRGSLHPNIQASSFFCLASAN